MKKESILRDKSYLFAIRIIRLSQFLQQEKKEYILSKQVLRSGTAIGALIREAEYAQSHADFINKFSISLKEANETAYWLSLVKDTDYIDLKLYKSIFQDCDELICLLVSTIKTLKAKTTLNS
ncbi:MAG: four helix bundle protein [Prevotellaceae bacterium]|jgi:four helix bundle protein|nr:four helix bundle protein [Prevotellaceae bacterium]